MEKMTNVSALTLAIATLSSVEDFNAEAIQKLENIKASYEKKSKAEKKPTQAQLDNAKLKPQIVALLNEPMTVSQIAKVLPGDYSSQKISALVRQLVAEGSVIRTEEKRKALFSRA